MQQLKLVNILSLMHVLCLQIHAGSDAIHTIFLISPALALLSRFTMKKRQGSIMYLCLITALIGNGNLLVGLTVLASVLCMVALLYVYSTKWLVHCPLTTRT